MTRRILAWTALAAALLAAAFVAHGCWVGHSRAVGYDRVELGDTEGRVVGLLGRPDRVRTDADECDREWWYDAPHTICGEAWGISLDGRGRVVSKYHYISP